MYNNLQTINDVLCKPNNLTITDLSIDTESKEYTACTFAINNGQIVFRSAKTTPTKIGQFVTLWKRPFNKEIVPYSNLDPIKLYLIYTKTTKNEGLFIFPKEILYKNNVLSDGQQPGKRGIRVYPTWDQPTSKQAIKSQQWQVPHFIDLKKEPLDHKRIKELFI